MTTPVDIRPMSVESEFDPAHIFGKVRLDYLDAKEALQRPVIEFQIVGLACNDLARGRPSN
jgi:hypothetical protein